MSFEYNGVVYRDLEPQVRYDAEQVQLLKQADVTINENLQTVNTEINGKLTKPTNPSAESVVTMLADGTVGTKLLSEIGGGGKLYRHEFVYTCGAGGGPPITISFTPLYSNVSTESAVTMLADGTVGTKLLSEIGGGGKLYKHIITFTNIGTIPPGYNYGRMTIISTYPNSYTSPTELVGIATGFTATVGSSNDNTMYTFVVLNSYAGGDGTDLALEGVKGASDSAILVEAITDTYVEL